MSKKYNKSPIKILLRGEIYHFKISTIVNGRRILIRESAHTKNRAEAEIYANKRFTQAIKEAEFRTDPNKLKEYTLDQALGLYWEEKGKYHSNPDDTFNKLENITKYFNSKMLLSDLTIDDISNYVRTKKDEGVKTGTINRYISIISAILNLCKKHRVNTPDIYVRDYIKKVPIDFGKFFTKQDYRKIYKQAPEHLKAIMDMGIETGFRMSNILGLKWQDIHDGYIWYLVKDSSYENGKRIEAKKITPNINKILTSQPRCSDYVFTYKGQRIKSIKRSWKTAITKAGVPYKCPHTIRHTHGTWLYEGTKDIKLVQNSLNHSEENMTHRYVHIIDNMENKAYNKALKFH